ncbi:MAG: tail fiber protein [Pseudomonadota bacterium]
MEPFIAQIMLFGGNFAPRGWAFCDGQLMEISQNQALFSILGTAFGGDGRTTYGLPDLRGRVAIGPRRGPGLTEHRLGERGGVESVVLMGSQIPSHNHSVTLRAEGKIAADANPTNKMLAAGQTIYVDDDVNQEVSMHPKAIQEANYGGNLAHENHQPFIAVNYIIALEGSYPSRS